MESDGLSRLRQEEERLAKLAETVPEAQLEGEIPEVNAARSEIREHLRRGPAAITGETAGRVGAKTARAFRRLLLGGIVEPLVFVQKMGQSTVSHTKSVVGNLIRKVSGS